MTNAIEIVRLVKQLTDALVDEQTIASVLDSRFPSGSPSVRNVREQYAMRKPVAAMEDDIEDTQPAPARRQPVARMVRPAVGYFPTDATMGKRGGSKIPALPHNTDATLMLVLREPGISARAIAERSGLTRKAVESALDWLRTHDGERNETFRLAGRGVREPIRGRKPLVQSRPLAE